ncbi:PDZ domain-containing protein [Roseiconus nitratireducens]|uniref:PDZ domain-containing protein n=1 Tax=Roseiconus nitratireducens TaxID=2605748 RepID=A0A5M6D6J3_9BACT|nr:PDZ domain-containing protein [Roseiconus nitratireducens]KAA5543157.1 PDZ domain-containing protein [Roseiconus nitratireducens]
MPLPSSWIPRSAAAAAVICFTGPLTCPPDAIAQETTSRTTALVVDGNVANVFRSDDQYLVQILVQRSEIPSLESISDAPYPAPGQYVYAHVGPDRSLLGRLTQNAAVESVPKPKTRIRARLAIGRDGQWEAAGGDWFQENPSPGSDTPTGSTASAEQLVGGLGVTTERAFVSGQPALKVVKVQPNSPAAKAGVEPGDVLVEANRNPLRSEAELAEAFRNRRGSFSLTVRDVRSGRDVLVPIDAEAPANSNPDGRMQPLGATTELAFYSGNAAVKVTAVAPGSPAQRSGLTPGLLILTANGRPIESPKALAEAEQESRGQLTLEVVDPKDRRQRTLRVSL